MAGQRLQVQLPNLVFRSLERIVDIAIAIAEWTGDQTEAGRSTDRKAVETTLRHTHLPKLVDGGIVSFGANTGFIELRDTDRFDRFLADMARIDGYMQTAAGDCAQEHAHSPHDLTVSY
ncbi:DUF7344 domain-containing protein [Halosolutus gelatinilyticus]|uniref:DUF7344 domain-containing protein n=1 Tax=Halosolutus gelatinilyticus TaxID=2931975 RepID=UPI003CE4489C